jgi:hypothetical protein
MLSAPRVREEHLEQLSRQPGTDGLHDGHRSRLLDAVA